MRQAANPRIDIAAALQAEHICLESEEFVVERRVRGTRVGPSLTIASRLRGCETELAFLSDHRLEVRMRRPHRVERRYAVDLRFVDAEPVTGRHIAWRWWLAGLALAVLAAAGYRLAALPDLPRWIPVVLPASIVLSAAAICVGLVALYRTRETILFHSVHGRTVLADITGGIGCIRTGSAFVAEVRRRVAAARAQGPQSRQQFLRDELREHRRLHEDGVLSEDVYEAGKRHILQAHG